MICELFSGEAQNVHITALNLLFFSSYRWHSDMVKLCADILDVLTLHIYSLSTFTNHLITIPQYLNDLPSICIQSEWVYMLFEHICLLLKYITKDFFLTLQFCRKLAASLWSSFNDFELFYVWTADF